MIGLTAILQKKGLTQVATAEAIGVSKQTVSKYLKCLQKIPEQKVELLENVLNVPRKYFVDEENYCNSLNTEQLYELHMIIDNTERTEVTSKEFKKDGRKQKFSSGAKAERDHLLQNLKSRKPFRYHDPKDKIEQAELERSNAEFCNQMLELRSEAALSQEQWESIMIAIAATVPGDTEAVQQLFTDKRAANLFNHFGKIGD